MFDIEQKVEEDITQRTINRPRRQLLHNLVSIVVRDELYNLLIATTESKAIENDYRVNRTLNPHIIKVRTSRTAFVSTLH